MSTFFNPDMDISIPGPLLPFSDSKALIAPAPFSDAVEHWRFGAGSSSRIGLVNSLPLRLGMTATGVTGGTGYTSAPTVTLSGAGATGITGFCEISASTAVQAGGISGQPADDTSNVTAALSGGGGSGAALTYSRGVEPTYNSKSMVIAAGRVNGLISSIDDAAVYSEAFLIKRPAANTVQLIGGSMISIARSRGTAVGGDLFQWYTSGGVDTIRWLSATGGTISMSIPASWTPGTWGVLIASQGASSRTMNAYGPDAASTTVSGAQAKTVANPLRKRSLGGIQYDTGSDYVALEIASWANWSSALASAAMDNKAFDLLDYARDAALIS